jgi:DNA-binding response OmpR family regulator
MKILVVEDEYEMLKSIEASLLSENYLVETATDYSSGIEKAMVYEYDCILLDISLPGGSGLRILEEMKKNRIAANVIIISARNSIDDKVSGLELGADDYLTKPFHMAELHARIKAVLRRKQFDGKDVLAPGNVLLDHTQRRASIDGQPLDLNRKEFDILVFFAANINRLITREALAENVWGDHIDNADNFDFIYAQIKNIRKKLKDGNAGIRLESVYGVGYKLIIDS